MMAYRLIVSGKVQGVGYRRFAQKQAQALGVFGWVRNLHDGRVEAFAQGTAEQLSVFQEKLRQGPTFGRVEDVKTSKAEPMDFQSFEVRADGMES